MSLDQDDVGGQLLQDRIVQTVEAMPTFEPAFQFNILWARDYDDLLSLTETVDEQTLERDPLQDVLRQASVSGRVVISAEGGSGKSSILAHLCRLALTREEWPILISLRDWTPTVLEAWNAQENKSLRANLLLSRLGMPSTTEAEFSSLGADGLCFMLVDGLNEIDARTGSEVLDVLDDFAVRHPHVAVIVSDRLVRRNLRPGRWRIGTIAPLSEREVSRHLSRQVNDKGLLRTAFFLDLAIKQGIAMSSSARSIAAFFERHTALPASDLVRAAEATFLTFLQLSRGQRLSRTFAVDPFREIAGDRATDALVEASVLVKENDGRAYFRHHLYQDYLNALWLVQDGELWQKESFDALSFYASSFDCLALALEQITNRDAANLFAQRIYDWNFYATTYALEKARLHEVSAVTEAMEFALLTMIAEKRWDPLKGTAVRVRDALTMFPSPTARILLSVGSLSELLDLVRSQPQSEDPEVESWRQIFTTPVHAEVPDALVASIQDEHSLRGWTVSNVLRRVRLSAGQVDALRAMIPVVGDIARWRIVHVLGAHPSPENVALLFDLLSSHEEYRWVRYGAVRALLECAALSADVRHVVIDGIRERVDLIKTDARILEEFENALLLRDPPSEWIQLVGPVIEDLVASAKTLESQEHWRMLAYEMQNVPG